MQKLKGFLSVKEAAEFVGVTCNTIRTYGDNGFIKVYRHPVNGYRLFKSEHLQEFMDSIRLETTKS